MKDIIKNIITDFHKRQTPAYVERKQYIPINSGKIISVIGARRSGKTYCLYQLMNKLPPDVDRSDLIYINFEDERLNLKSENLNLILESYYELYPGKNKPLYFFFDEIQNIQDWERFVRRIYDTVSKNIFITGSSSKLLSKEIASSLRGRSISYEIYPLMFDEYLKFKDIDSTDISSTRNKSKIINAFSRYLYNGAFPETINYDKDLRLKTLRSYLDVMTYRDIIERYEVKNPTALKYFIKKSLSNVSNYLSVNKLFNELRSSGIKLSKDSIYEFINYANDCYLFFLINIYSESINVQNTNDKKLYCIDNGLANILSFRFSEDKGRMLENVIYLHFKRKGYNIFYFFNKRECDFIIQDGTKISNAIQAAYELNSNNREREVQGLVEAMKCFKLKNGLILTNDQSEEIEVENLKITIKPVWKWALGDNDNPK